MAPWTSAAAYECAAAQSMDPWAAIKKASQACSGDTSSCSSPCPAAACPEFYIGCRLGKELFTLPVCYPDAHEAMGCDQKCLIILVVWRWHHQLLFDSLSKGRLSRVSRRLVRKFSGHPRMHKHKVSQSYYFKISSQGRAFEPALCAGTIATCII